MSSFLNSGIFWEISMKNVKIDIIGVFVLLIIFCFMYILNSLTPLLADDYFSAFLWPEGIRLNDVSHEAIKRISSFDDIYESLKGYYFTWGGRIPGGIPVPFFIWRGKEFFNPCNAFLFTLLVAEIYWLSHEGKVSLDFKPSYIFGIFFALWTFNVKYIDTCLWLAGSCNYLWMMVVVLAFLIPYIRNYFDANTFRDCKTELTIGITFLGILAGWSHETTNCWIIIVLSYWLYISYKKDEWQLWKITGYIGFCIGYALLIFAPGNFSRLQMQQQTSRLILTSDLLNSKLSEFSIIFLFHFVIWYFIIRFFFKYGRYKDFFNQKESGLYLSCALAFIIIAFGSGITMFFIPSSGLRPSFLNLVFLIISAALLFRLQELNDYFFVDNHGALFLKSVGCLYLVVTMSFSLWGCYINRCYLNDILVQVREASNNSTGTFLEFKPPVTMQNDMWFYGSGIHLVPLPVSTDESHEFNKAFSYFYGIKGIKIR